MVKKKESSKECSKCNVRKPLSDFPERKAGKLKRHSWCYNCIAKNAKGWREKRNEEERERKERVNEHAHNTSALKRKGICTICNKYGLTARHHLIPSRYGIHNKENLLEVCSRCHGLIHGITTMVLWDRSLLLHQELIKEIITKTQQEAKRRDQKSSTNTRS